MALLQHIKEILTLFTKAERKKLFLVLMISIFMALIEVIGVGSIMPFISVATKPETIHTNIFLSWIFAYFGFKKDVDFLIFLGIGVLFFLISTNITQAIMAYIKTRFGSMRRHSISTRLMEGYLTRDYPFFLNRNSFDFVKTITTEVDQFIKGSVMQLVDLIARTIQTCLLLAFLFIVNPVSTLIVTVAIAIIYGAIYNGIRRILHRLGKQRLEMFSLRAKIVSESLWGIKEVKITGTEKVFLEQYKVPSKDIAIVESQSEIVGDVPKFALETIAFSSIMVFIMVTMIRFGDFSEIAGSITLFAYAGYRLIPAVQGLFKALTKVKYSSATAKKLIREFESFGEIKPLARRKSARLEFKKKLTINNLTFTYPKSDSPVIEGLSFEIQANQMVGFAGTTGSGKTTIVDILLGLLQPDSGTITVDDINLDTQNVEAWQLNLGYVPQNIYLSDNSLYENIAFGIPPEEIDEEQVVEAAKKAQIHDFILNSLPKRYDTHIGERGIRLSGGQKQRIGIARALYRNPTVLVMDEATSALDNQTENAVMEAIDSLQGTRTIILIAHRLSTLKKCDVIFVLEKGKIIDKGSYDELSDKGAFFVNNDSQ